MRHSLIRHRVFAIFLGIRDDDAMLRGRFHRHDFYTRPRTANNTATGEMCEFLWGDFIARQQRVGCVGVGHVLYDNELMAGLLNDAAYPLKRAGYSRKYCDFPHVSVFPYMPGAVSRRLPLMPQRETS